MSRIHDGWELDLTPVHRALLALCRERTTRIEHAALEGMSESQLAAMLCGFLREEYVTIPAATAVTTCGRCHARICWIPFDHPHYRSSFVVDGSEGVAPTASDPGYGYHHIADCVGSGLVQMANARYARERDVEPRDSMLPSPQHHEVNHAA